MNIQSLKKNHCILILLLCFFAHSGAQTTSVGSGGYTNNFPGTDVAGRNGFPSGSPQLSGNAIGKPVPTNDWWSSLIKENHASNLFNYPMTMKTTPGGLIVTYIPWGVIGDSSPIQVGLTGLNAAQATASDYSDWTVSMNWNDGSHDLTATAGIGMPFVYFEKGAANEVAITINSGTVTINDEIIIIENASANADFIVYAPVGSSWSQNGTTFTSSLNGENYWSMAMLPLDNTSVTTLANEYQKYAYVFPSNTEVSWAYSESDSKVLSTFVVDTDVKDGSQTNTEMLLGLLPHQWDNLSSASSTPNEYSYNGVRGEIKTLKGNAFEVENTFKGILPTLPYVANYSDGFSPSDLNEKISLIENDELASWTDSYNEGQMMNRMIQTARIADQTGDLEARNNMVATIKNRLEDWLHYQSGEVAFLFYYDATWSSLLGYPSGHGQDNNINDHHFHWGYFIHAAAFMEQFEPGWVDEWGAMINLLIRDAASFDRNDDQFPFLRNFSPYAGHSWANGFATFPQGNDQESTSESMQFASSLIHWGSIIEDTTIRDLGIYIYTTEQSAVEEYWFDIQDRNFQASTAPFSQEYSVVSRVWGNSFDNGTFFTSDIAASYGIELYPMHAGSLYLGHHQDYAQSLWSEMASNTGILSNEVNPNLWHDTYWKYLALTDAPAAIELYNSFPDRNLKFGISDAQTYHWLHAMNALGPVDASITSNYPIAAAFSNNGDMTYVAHNYSDNTIQVSFSDNFVLEVPANSMATSKDSDASGVISSDFYQAYPDGSVNLTVITDGTNISKVQFFDGTEYLGEDISEPYEFRPLNLDLGTHGMYAKVYQNDSFNVTNIIDIQVGEQVPYLGIPFDVPGIVEAGLYDSYEGGIGQNISYLDLSIGNASDFRITENVDAGTHPIEGAIVGYIAAGEWIEYTIDVATAGVYDLSLRYASGNSNGGGPFYFEIDGNKISQDIVVTTTSDWDSWSTKTATNIELNKGLHVLRLVITNGEFNIGKMTFSYNAPLTYMPPFADAGDNVSVILPQTTASLDGSLSTDEDTAVLTYFWEQLYGPSTVVFSDNSTAMPEISNLEAGVYKIKLTVSDDAHSSSSDMLVIVSENGNTNPSISITSPSDNSNFDQGTSISIEAVASDIDGTISKVEFYDGTTLIGEDVSAPFSFSWTDATIGLHDLTAKAIDNEGGESTSSAINITVNELFSCIETGTAAQQGSFSVGYKSTFETVGTDVTITFELLDTDKFGVVAYLWQESPFSEAPMDQVSGNIFSKTLGGQTPGATISYACKFAFSGGLAVTQYVSYVVGSDCSGSSDSEAPTSFTANIGAILASSVELLLEATDDSGTIVYDISYDNGSETVTGSSGNETSISITALAPETNYTFEVTALDLAGNINSESPITLNATTGVDASTSCSGSASEAQQGSFDVGYNYDFQTSGNAITFTFELLDDKDGVVAYLWEESPFTETPMDNVTGKTFSKTLSGFTPGELVSFGCKFAFAGGLAVTKYFTYEVGDNCSLGVVDFELENEFKVHPNPSIDIWNITGTTIPIKQIIVYDLIGKEVFTSQPNELHTVINGQNFSSGIYFANLVTSQGRLVVKLIKD